MKKYASYNGGKNGNGTYQNIINHIPKHEVYVEAFFGNGGIYHNLKRPARSVINDINSAVIDGLDYGSSTTILNMDYKDLIDIYDHVGQGVFFYLDPPYLMETRRSQKKLYTFEFNKNDHERFLEKVLTVKSDCMISHYPCKMYDEALKGWYAFDFNSMTRQGIRVERLYMNYPTPSVLQDFRYLGTDFTDRQRIKRKIERHINRLEELDELERTGILSAIIAKYNFTSATLLNQSPRTI